MFVVCSAAVNSLEEYVKLSVSTMLCHFSKFSGQEELSMSLRNI